MSVELGKATILSFEIDGRVYVSRAETKMRRFVLKNIPEGKSWEGVVFSNGCVVLNLHPDAYRTHFCDMKEFLRIHVADEDHELEWIDKDK